MTSSVELKPRRELLDSNFDGYKLSLREIPTKKKNFENLVDHILLSSNQYSVLHAKLFGLQNHLVGDQYDETNSVYFIDEDWNINKVYVDLNGELIEPLKIWQIPKIRERTTGDYNASVKFVSPDLAVVGDGTGYLYVLKTGCRDNDDRFSVAFSDEVAGPNEAFIILDAVYDQEKSNPELHLLLLSIKQENPKERYSSLLHWITLKLNNNSWSQTALKQLKAKSNVQYAALETNGEAVYIVTDSGSKMVLNSDYPITNNIEELEDKKYLYEWSQTIEEISVVIELPENADKALICVESDSAKIDIKYNGTSLISGSLYQTIDGEMTTWTVKSNKLEILFVKQETGIMWPEFIVNDVNGKKIVNSCIIEQVNEKLEHITSEDQTIPQSGTTFSSQPVEDCDFENDQNTVFEKISGVTNTTTHKINLGSHQVLMTAQLSSKSPLAFGVRHDVDICLWQPDGSKDSFSVNHEGTLLALGYVQASKQNRKFLVCPPNMAYSVICESSGHIFIYRQKRAISSNELRHRTTGRRVQNIAEQQVVNVTNNEILGIHAFNNKLFLLIKNCIMMLEL